MSMAIPFDTLKFPRRLKDAGVLEKQDVLDFRREIMAMEERLRREMQALEYRMTIKLGGLMMAAVGAVAALVKLL